MKKNKPFYGSSSVKNFFFGAGGRNSHTPHSYALMRGFSIYSPGEGHIEENLLTELLVKLEKDCSEFRLTVGKGAVLLPEETGNWMGQELEIY